MEFLQQNKKLAFMQVYRDFAQNHYKFVQEDIFLFLFNPLERIKIIHQTSDIIPNVLQQEVQQYDQGLFKGLNNLYEDQGFRNLWRGGISRVIKFFTQKYFENLFYFGTPQHSPQIKTVLRLFSSFLGLLLAYPLNTLQVHMATEIQKTSSNKLQNIFNSFYSISKSEGIQGFYYGFAASVAGLFVYKLTQNCFNILYNKYKLNTSKWFPFSQSYFSIIAALFASYPFQTIRNRMILQSGAQNKLYTSSLECFKSINKEGFFNLYKGFDIEMKIYFFSFVFLTIFATFGLFSLYVFVGKENKQILVNDFSDYVSTNINQKSVSNSQDQQQSN